MEEIKQKIKALSCFDDPTDIRALGGGLTNVNMLVRDGAEQFVVRLGSDIPEHGVLRWNELALSKAAHRAGVSPYVVHHEPGVLVLDFVEAHTFTEADVCNPDNLRRVINLIKRTHRGIPKRLRQPVLTFWPPHVNRTYIGQLMADNTPYRPAMSFMLAQNDMFEKAIGQIDLVVGHNDLLAANILDDGEKLLLIDWEYGGFNSPLFDLAGLASNNGLSEAQERAMLEQYFEADADTCWRAYSAMKCCSLMRETLWSMTSEIHSDLDVDFGAYTIENFKKFTAAFADFVQT